MSPDDSLHLEQGVDGPQEGMQGLTDERWCSADERDT